MLTAKEIMTENPIAVTPETKITEAARLLLENRINGLPVVDEAGNLIGIICQSDLIAQQKKISLPSLFTILDSFIPLSAPSKMEREIQKVAATSVDHAMTRKPVAVGPDATVEEIATLMVEKNFHTIPVVENGKLVGVIGKEDVLRTIMG